MENNSLHIAVFPWLAFGHMIPFLELSKHLASKGHRFSYISTPRNVQRLLPKIPRNLAPFITLVPLPLPRKNHQIEDHNLPIDAESTMDVPVAKVEFLKKASDGLQNPLSQFLKTTSPRVDWIIYDFNGYWVPPIADALGIRKAYFSIVNSFTMATTGPPSRLIGDDGGSSSYWTGPKVMTRQPEWIPFRTNIVYRLYEAKLTYYVMQKNASEVADAFRLGNSIKGSDMVCLRSCVELEAEYLSLLEKLYEKRVFPVGLLPVSTDEEHGQDDTWRSIVGWLDCQISGSVLYVALGSEIAPSQDQIDELALGLEMAQVSFLWAWRKPAGSSAELPGGFEDRIRGRGLVWARWVPQPRVLAHGSVGAFLTHCGWGSVVEGLQFGRPLVMLPFFWDQATNTRFMVANKVGVEIPRDEQDGSFTRSSVAESVKLVLKGEAAEIFKTEAKKMSCIFANERLNTQEFDKFEQYLISMKQ